MNAVAVAAIAAIPGSVAAWLAYKQATKVAAAAGAAEVRKVEAGAYERARKLYEAGIEQLEEQVRRMREQLATEQDVSNRLRNQVNELEATVGRLRAQLIRAGIDLGQPIAHQVKE
jgi:hypothetical protein